MRKRKQSLQEVNRVEKPKSKLNCRVLPSNFFWASVSYSFWSGREDLNLRPPAPKAGALPGCATPRRLIETAKDSNGYGEFLSSEFAGRRSPPLTRIHASPVLKGPYRELSLSVNEWNPPYI